MVSFAQYEREQISKRTREALAIVKQRGTNKYGVACQMGGFRGRVVDHEKGTAALVGAAGAFAASVAR
jgi:DNA invertase Pin-like site-specific DNA recombinase